MNKNLLFIFILVLILGFLALLYYFFGISNDNIGIIPSEPTGNIEDIEKSLLEEIVDMNNLFLEEDADANLINSDSSVFDDFGRLINEDEL